MKEHTAHPGSHASHHSDLAAEPGVVVGVLDEDLDIGRVPVLAPNELIVGGRGRVVRGGSGGGEGGQGGRVEAGVEEGRSQLAQYILGAVLYTMRQAGVTWT